MLVVKNMVIMLTFFKQNVIKGVNFMYSCFIKSSPCSEALPLFVPEKKKISGPVSAAKINK